MEAKPQIEKEFEERVIEINRVSRTVKGGRRIRFRALVVVGDQKGSLGIGIAKAAEVQQAVQKAFASARRNRFSVPLENGTIMYATKGFCAGAYVILKPARPGTSVIAGGPVRAIAEVVGIKNIITKSLGSSNKLNTVRAVQNALRGFNLEPKTRIRTSSLKTLHPKKQKPSAVPKAAIQLKPAITKPKKERDGIKRTSSKTRTK